jgi:membrane protein implicated in regulation of membrane protease activity
VVLVFWLVLGVVLLVVELTHFGFFAVFAALGAFAAALVALVLPDAVALQVLVALAVCGIGIWAFRPLMRAALHNRTDSHPARGVHGTLVGEEVLTLDVVGDAGDQGHVRLAGERWLATSGSGQPIPAGKRVVVTGVQGTTLVVWPVEGEAGYVADLEESTPPQLPEGAEGESS